MLFDVFFLTVSLVSQFTHLRKPHCVRLRCQYVEMASQERERMKTCTQLALKGHVRGKESCH